MAKSKRRKGAEDAPAANTPDTENLALVEQIVSDRGERLDLIQDEIWDVLGVPRHDTHSAIVLKEFPYLKSDFETVVDPAVAELRSMYDGSQAKLNPSEEQQKHNELVARIDGFFTRLKEDLRKLKERKGIVQKDPVKPGGAKKDKVEKGEDPVDPLAEAKEIFDRIKVVKSHIERFSADSYKNKVEEVKRLIRQVAEIKKLYESVSDSDKKVAQLSRDKYLERLRRIDTDILKILDELEDEQLSHIESGEYKTTATASKIKAGPYVPPWGMYDAETLYTTPVEKTAEEGVGGAANSEDSAFVPPQFSKPAGVSPETEQKTASSEGEAFREKIGAFYPIDDQEMVDKLYESIEVMGGEFNGAKLTREILKEEGLLPAYGLELGKRLIFLPQKAFLLNDRAVAICYVENEGKIVPRTYYRSNFQASWRFLPSYTVYPDDPSVINWFHKGYDENSLNAPAELQSVLDTVVSKQVAAVDENRADLIFAGTVHELSQRKLADTDYAQEISKDPIKFFENLKQGDLPDPESIQLPETYAPDFSAPDYRWESDNAVYGHLIHETFASKDGSLRYTFCRDSNNRAWVAAIEKISVVGATGLHTKWVDPGPIGTPLGEYPGQAIDWGNPGDMYGGVYVDMYKNYLSKVPVIQEYLAATLINEPNIPPDSVPPNHAEPRPEEVGSKDEANANEGAGAEAAPDPAAAAEPASGEVPPDPAEAEMSRLRAVLPDNEALAEAFGSVEAAESYAKAVSENNKFREEYRKAKAEYKRLDLIRNKDQARQGPIGTATRWFSKEAKAEDRAWQEVEARMKQVEMRRFELLGQRIGANEQAKAALRGVAGKFTEMPEGEKKFDVEKRLKNHFVINDRKEKDETRLQALEEVSKERAGTWAGKTLNTIKNVTTTLGKHRGKMRLGVGAVVVLGAGLTAAPAVALAAGAAAGAAYGGRVVLSMLGTSVGAGTGRWFGNQLVNRSLEKQKAFRDDLQTTKLTADNFEVLRRTWNLNKDDEKNAKKIRSVSTVIGGVVGGGFGYAFSSNVGVWGSLDTTARPAAASQTPNIEHQIKQGDHSLWRITQRQFGESLDRLTPTQKDNVLSQTFNEIQASPQLRSQLGLRSGSTVNQIYVNESLNLGVVKEILDKKVASVLPAAPVAPIQTFALPRSFGATFQSAEQLLGQQSGAKVTLVEAASTGVAAVGTLGQIRDSQEKAISMDPKESRARKSEDVSAEEVLAEGASEWAAEPGAIKLAGFDPSRASEARRSAEAPRSFADILKAANERSRNGEEFKPDNVPGDFLRIRSAGADDYNRLLRDFEQKRNESALKGFWNFVTNKEKIHSVTANLSFKELKDGLTLPDGEIEKARLDKNEYRDWVKFVGDCVEELKEAGFAEDDLSKMSVGSILYRETQRRKEYTRSSKVT